MLPLLRCRHSQPLCDPPKVQTYMGMVVTMVGLPCGTGLLHPYAELLLQFAAQRFSRGFLRFELSA